MMGNVVEHTSGTNKWDEHVTVKDDTRHSRAAQKGHEHAQRAYIHRLTRRPPRFRNASSESATNSGKAFTNKEYAGPMPSNCSDSAPVDCINGRAVIKLPSSSIPMTSERKTACDMSVPIIS